MHLSVDITRGMTVLITLTLLKEMMLLLRSLLSDWCEQMGGKLWSYHTYVYKWSYM